MEGAVCGHHTNLVYDLINSYEDLQQAIMLTEIYGRLSLQNLLSTQQQRDKESAQLLLDFSHTIINESKAKAQVAEFEQSLAPSDTHRTYDQQFFK